MDPTSIDMFVDILENAPNSTSWQIIKIAAQGLYYKYTHSWPKGDLIHGLYFHRHVFGATWKCTKLELLADNLNY